MESHLLALTLPLYDLVAYVRKQEDAEANRMEPGKLRRQTYDVRFALEQLLHAARRLTRGRRMTPRLAAQMFGPGPRQAAGPGRGVFLASSPRLRDVGGGPTSAAVEKSLSDGFVVCYMLHLLEHGSESELGSAAEVLRGAILGWAARLSQSAGPLGWAPAMFDVASALICLCSGVYSAGSLEALSRVQAAADGPARRVSFALMKHPWAARARRAQSNRLPAKAIFHSAWLARPAGSLRSRPEAGGMAAEDPLEPRVRRKRRTNMKTPPADAFDAAEAVRCTRANAARQRDVAFQAAARLEPSSAWFDGGESLRVKLIAGRAAAEECRGMNLGGAELGPAFGRIVGFLRAACREHRVLRRGSEEEADVLAAVDCGLAMADAMGSLGCCWAEALPAQPAYGRTALSWLLQIACRLARSRRPTVEAGQLLCSGRPLGLR